MPPGSGTPSVQNRSLTASGTPASGPAAASGAWSATQVKAFSSSAAARSR